MNLMIMLGEDAIAPNLLNNSGVALMQTGSGDPEVFEVIDRRILLTELEDIIFKYNIQACLVRGLTGFEYDKSLEMGLNIYFAEEGTVEENVKKFVDDMLAFEGTTATSGCSPSSCSSCGSGCHS